MDQQSVARNDLKSLNALRIILQGLDNFLRLGGPEDSEAFRLEDLLAADSTLPVFYVDGGSLICDPSWGSCGLENRRRLSG